MMKKLIAVCLSAAIALGAASMASVNAQTKVKMGDADLNGKVNVVDATYIQQYIASVRSFDATQTAVADVDKNGSVNVNDVTMVQKIAASLVTMDEEIDPVVELTPELVKEQGSAGMNDFAVRLLQGSEQSGQNTLVSPLSVLYALGMTSNGAQEKTLTQMEQAMGMNRGLLNEYLKAYPSYATSPYNTAKVSIANSIWYNNSVYSSRVSPVFLSTVNQYYKAEIYPTQFDQQALDAINSWVNKKTDGMIPSILKDIDPMALMYLVNALAFEADWEEPYITGYALPGSHAGEAVIPGDVFKDTFTAEDGTATEVDMMRSQENYYLLDNEGEYGAQGFIKPYDGRSYAFAALLPDEGVKLSDYVQSLDGDRLRRILKNRQYDYDIVNARMPKFELEYEDSLVDNLQAMGMTDAFEDTANFKGLLADPNGLSPYISEVLHKTFISVTEQGTRAGAATIVEIKEAATPPPEEEPKDIFLDRPFLYMIINTETNTPLFIGTVEKL